MSALFVVWRAQAVTWVSVVVAMGYLLTGHWVVGAWVLRACQLKAVACVRSFWVQRRFRVWFAVAILYRVVLLTMVVYACGIAFACLVEFVSSVSVSGVLFTVVSCVQAVWVERLYRSYGGVWNAFGKVLGRMALVLPVLCVCGAASAVLLSVVFTGVCFVVTVIRVAYAV